MFNRRLLFNGAGGGKWPGKFGDNRYRLWYKAACSKRYGKLVRRIQRLYSEPRFYRQLGGNNVCRFYAVARRLLVSSRRSRLYDKQSFVYGFE